MWIALNAAGLFSNRASRMIWARPTRATASGAGFVIFANSNQKMSEKYALIVNSTGSLSNRKSNIRPQRQLPVAGER